jgi:hypothetical protein
MQKTFGVETTAKVYHRAAEVYPDIVQKIPFFNTPMYDSLIGMASKMAALKKGMKEAGIGVEEFVKFNIEGTRATARKIPEGLRRLGGRIYLSRFLRGYLKKVAYRVTAYGWPTKVIDGTGKDDFEMSVETENCQMVVFWESIGEGDIKPYCSFFDFSMAEMLGMGLEQVSTIDSGVCKYCFKKEGSAKWPEPVRKILDS